MARRRRPREPDPAALETDKRLAELEQRIAAEYEKARADLDKEVREYWEKLKKRDAEMQKLIGTVQNGQIWTVDDYKRWRLNQEARGRRFEALRDKMAERYTQANEVAISYLNDATPGIYSLNRNYSAYTIDQDTGGALTIGANGESLNADFILFDEQTVKKLIVERPDVMPYYPEEKAVQRGIDLEYGKRQITKTVTSGILTGKGVGQMADDLQEHIETMNRTSAIRAARTGVTEAQNAGRMDSYHQAEEMGIKLRKEWLATLDGRTRHEHRILDGQKQDNDKPFVVEGEEIMFPGDPSAPAHLVYNCRCTLIADVEGVDTSDALRRDKLGTVSNMTYTEWENSIRGKEALEYERKRNNHR